MLHALLCQLCGSAASEGLARFLRVDEMLTDIADDLFDYEKVHAPPGHALPRRPAHSFPHLCVGHTQELVQRDAWRDACRWCYGDAGAR